MATPHHHQTLTEFLDAELFPALFAQLDSAFPEFGWRNKGSLWQATNEATTKNLADSPRPSRVQAYRNTPFGFKIHGGDFVPWLAYLNGGARPLGSDFIKVVQTLAAKAGVTLPERELSAADQAHTAARERRSHLLEAFLVLTKAALHAPDGAPARHYLNQRGLADDFLAHSDFGYLPASDALRHQLLRHGFTAQEITDAGLLHDTRWAGRVVHPWRDTTGRISTYWARDITGAAEAQAKYLFLAGGTKSAPFGVEAIKGKDLILVEGLMDVLTLRSQGVENVLALGGAQLTAAQKQSLERMRPRSITLSLDYDPKENCAAHHLPLCLWCAAGWQGTHKSLELLRESRARLYVLEPHWLADRDAPARKADPDSYVRQHGAAAFQSLVSQAVKAALFRARELLRRHDLSSNNGKDAAVLEVLAYDATLTDPRDSADLWQLVAEQVGYPPETLRQLAARYHDQERQTAVTHELGRVLQGSLQELQTRRSSPQPLLENLTQQLETLHRRVQTDEPAPFSVPQLIINIKQAGEGKTSGWQALDKLGVRFQPAELAVLGGRTGHGKTTALLALLLNWLNDYPDEVFALYSYELPPEAILLKLASALTYLCGASWSYYDIKDWWQQKPDRDYPNPAALHEAQRILEQWQERLLVVYRPQWTVADLCQHAHRAADEKERLGGVLVDYLQLVPPPAGEFDRRDMAISSVARHLKKLAVDLSCPVVSAAQIGRQAVQGAERIPEGALTDRDVTEAIKKRRPQLHHLREGGSEQEADLVLGLLNYRADFLEGQSNLNVVTPGATRFEILTLKNRYGGGGIATLAFEGRTGTLRDVTGSDGLPV